MMLNRIQVTTVFVSDQNRALDFYTNKLGLQVKFDAELGQGFRWLEVIPANGETSIALLMPFPGQQVGGETGFLWDTSDLGALYDRLSASGVNFTEPPAQTAWGALQAKFSDPDGNVYAVVQRQY